MIQIRKAQYKDREHIWRIIKVVIASGDTNVFDPDSPINQMLKYWMGHDKHAYVAMMEDRVVDNFVIKANQPRLGSHVANGSFMTSSKHEMIY